MEVAAMITVALSEAEIEERIAKYQDELGKVEVSAVNAPRLVVLGGSVASIERWTEKLNSEGVWTKTLQTSHAYHTWQMEEAARKLEEAVEKVEKRKPQMNMLSGVTGTWLSAEEAQSSRYWGRQMRERVQFAAMIDQILAERDRVVVETGPGSGFGGLVKQQAQERGSTTVSVVSLLGAGASPMASEPERLLRGLGQIWLEGVAVKWEELWHGERRLRVELPTYPFERRRCWIEPQNGNYAAPVFTGRQPDIADWFYVPSWKRSPLATLRRTDEKLCWLVFTSKNEFGAELVKQLREQGQQVISISSGTKFAKLGEGAYKINPHEQKDFSALLKELATLETRPQRLIHLWGLNPAPRGLADYESFEKVQAESFYSLLFLIQALDEYNITEELDLTTVSDSVQEVTGQELLHPEKASVLGLNRIIHQEYSNISCRNIDVMLPKSKGSQRDLVGQLLLDLNVKPADRFVAYRGEHRWTESFEPMRVEGESRLCEEGLYLITGGLSAINLDLAEYLAREARAKLVFAGRTAFPLREEWEQWLSSYGEDHDVSRKIRRLLELEGMGAKVLVTTIEVDDVERLRQTIGMAQDQFGPLKGIFYNDQLGSDSESGLRATMASECGWYLLRNANALKALESVVAKTEPDFCLLLSSLTAVVGGRGLIASAAASQILDAYAHKKKEKASTRWLSLNLDTARPGRRQDQDSDLTITPEEVAEVFRRAWSLETVSQLAVSTVDLRQRLRQEESQDAGNEEAEGESGGKKQGIKSYSRPSLATAYVAPRNELERTIAEMFETLLGISPVGVNDDFFELGGHSLAGIQLTFRLRGKFELEDLHQNALFDKPTIAGLAETVEEIRRSGLTMPPNLVPIQPEGKNPPFFCVHPVGGSVYGLVPLGRSLAPDQPFYAISSTDLAHYGEYEDYETLDQMAADYIKTIKFVSPKGPYFIGGLSYGGMVAFAMAQQLKRNGEEVALLALLDSPAPTSWTKVGDLDDSIILLGLTRERARQEGIYLDVTGKDFVGLSADERLMFLVNALKESGLAPPDLSEEWIRRFMRGYRARINVVRNYVSQPYHGKITLFRCTERDPEMEIHLKGVGQDEYMEESFGWNKVSTEPVDVIPLYTYHEVMTFGENTKVLRALLKDRIDRAWNESIRRKSVGA
jgi:thioesterase domain-containing protein